MNLEIIAIAAFAGLAVSVSPCQLPVYPVILNMLSAKGVNRRLVSVSFAAGHSIMYALLYLGLALTMRAIGFEAFERSSPALFGAAYVLAGLICIGFAMQTLFGIKFFIRTIGIFKKGGEGVVGAFTTGALFATVVSPCNIPYLIALFLPLLSRTQTILEGLLGIAIFTSFVSLPILIFGISSGMAFSGPIKAHMDKIKKASAIALAFLGVYFIDLAFS